MTAGPTLLLFGYLAVARQLPHVVDIYGSLVSRALFTPPYLMALVFYDGPWGLEQLVYLVAPSLPVSGASLWAVGLVMTYYLFALVAVWGGRQVKRWGRSGNGAPGESAL